MDRRQQNQRLDGFTLGQLSKQGRTAPRPRGPAASQAQNPPPCLAKRGFLSGVRWTFQSHEHLVLQFRTQLLEHIAQHARTGRTIKARRSKHLRKHRKGGEILHLDSSLHSVCYGGFHSSLCEERRRLGEAGRCHELDTDAVVHDAGSRRHYETTRLCRLLRLLKFNSKRKCDPLHSTERLTRPERRCRETGENFSP